jgi:hypothetical protein
VPEDFELIKGGCDIKCEGTLPCGHRCPYPCKFTNVRTCSYMRNILSCCTRSSFRA